MLGKLIITVYNSSIVGRGGIYSRINGKYEREMLQKIVASNKWGEEYNPFIKLVLTLLLFLVTAFRPRKEGDLKIIWPIISLLLQRRSQSITPLRPTMSKSKMLIMATDGIRGGMYSRPTKNVDKEMTGI